MRDPDSSGSQKNANRTGGEIRPRFLFLDFDILRRIMNGVLGSAVLDVAIGLMFVYLLLSLICTTLNEWMSGILNTRSTMLKQALQNLLNNQPVTPIPGSAAQVSSFLELFYRHPIINAMLRQPGARDQHFSYLPARTFSAVIMDLVTPQKPGRINLAQLESGINSLPDGPVKVSLLTAIQSTGNSLEEAQQSIEAWFDDNMDRVSGWYKRVTQKWTIVFALLVTIALNADTVRMSKTLWLNPTLRAEVVAQATTRTTNTTVISDNTQASRQEMKMLESFVGWGGQELHVMSDPLGVFERLLGWILTAVAISLGAPFWFDTLNKIMNLRNAGKNPTETSKSPEKPIAPPANQKA